MIPVRVLIPACPRTRERPIHARVSHASLRLPRPPVKSQRETQYAAAPLATRCPASKCAGFLTREASTANGQYGRIGFLRARLSVADVPPVHPPPASKPATVRPAVCPSKAVSAAVPTDRRPVGVSHTVKCAWPPCHAMPCHAMQCKQMQFACPYLHCTYIQHSSAAQAAAQRGRHASWSPRSATRVIPWSI